MSHARILLMMLALFAAAPAIATDSPVPLPDDPPSRQHLAPAGMEGSYHNVHYTPVVRVGDMLIVSGIPAGRGDTYEAKVRWMFEQLKAHLETAGATLADVVELTTFHAEATDPESFGAEFARFAPIHHEYFPVNYPAWTAVGTTALLQPGAPVEMRAMAILGSGRNPRVDIPQPRARPVKPQP